MKKLIFLAVLGLSACVPSTQATSSHASEFEIVSFNIYVDFVGESWAKRSQGFHEYLDRDVPEIIAIQEASELQIADIVRKQPEYAYHVGVRSDGWRGDQSWYEFVPILYRKDRFELVDDGSLWVSDTPREPGSILPDSVPHGRPFTWVVLKDRVSQMEYLIGNVHIHWIRQSDQIEIIKTIVSQVGHSGPIILLGDFNMTPDTEGYRTMVMSRQLGRFEDAHDIALKRLGPSRTILEGSEYAHDVDGKRRYQDEPANRRIDYIFVCGIEHIREFETIPNRLADGSFVSDHFAVSAAISGAATCGG